MRLLEYDPFTGIKTYFKQDGQKTILMDVQDVDPIIEKNKFEAAGLDKRKNFWKVGELPLNICYQWSQECGKPVFSKEWQEYARKKLNDSDYRKFNQNKIKL